MRGSSTAGAGRPGTNNLNTTATGGYPYGNSPVGGAGSIGAPAQPGPSVQPIGGYGGPVGAGTPTQPLGGSTAGYGPSSPPPPDLLGTPLPPPPHGGEFAGYAISAKLFAHLSDASIPRGEARTVRLSNDPGEAALKIDGRPLWRQAEPGTDPALSAALGRDIVDWARACAG